MVESKREIDALSNKVKSLSDENQHMQQGLPESSASHEVIAVEIDAVQQDRRTRDVVIKDVVQQIRVLS